MDCDVEKAFLRRTLDIAEPFGGDAVAEQFVVRLFGEKRHCRLFRERQLCLDVSRDNDFFYGFAQLDQLSGPGRRVGFQLAAFGPRIRLVVMVDVT